MKTAFAKDIPFTAKSKRAISPVEYENKLLDICQDHGWDYSGLLLPVGSPFQRTKVVLTIDGKQSTPMIQHVLSGSFKGVGKTQPPKKKFSRTEEEHLEVAREFYSVHGWDVLGCAEPYCGVDTKLILRCHCHGKIHKKGDLHNNRRQGGLTCPIVRGALKAIQNGYKQIARSKDAQRPMYFYVFRVGSKFIKYGITTRKDPLQRLREHQKTTTEEITFEYARLFNIGWQAGDLETGIKMNIRGKKIPRKVMTQGYTETLPISKLPEVMKFIEGYIASNPSDPVYFHDEFDFSLIDFVPSEEEIDQHFAMMEQHSIDVDYSELDLSPLDAL